MKITNTINLVDFLKCHHLRQQLCAAWQWSDLAVNMSHQLRPSQPQAAPAPWRVLSAQMCVLAMLPMLPVCL